MGRLVFFGIDGLDYFLWKSLMDRGVMPFSKTLMQKGTLVPMDSSYPEVSSAAWASIITGKNPGGHNIFGFTDLIPGTYTLGFTSSKTCKAKPFWQEDSSRKSLIINIPQTYPAQPLHGILVSGFVSIDLAKGVYPLEELPVFQNAGYQFDVDSSLAAESKVLFYEGLFDVLRKRESILHHYWEEQAWDTIFFVVTGTDRLNHHGWWDFEDTASPFHQDYLNFYTEVDRVLSRVVDRLHPDDSLVILSDHGFERQDYSLNVNRFLQDHGFLHLRDEKYMNHNCILPGTKALAMDPGRIYFHREGRFPAGSVREEDPREGDGGKSGHRCGRRMRPPALHRYQVALRRRLRERCPCGGRRRVGRRRVGHPHRSSITRSIPPRRYRLPRWRLGTHLSGNAACRWKSALKDLRTPPDRAPEGLSSNHDPSSPETR